MIFEQVARLSLVTWAADPAPDPAGSDAGTTVALVISGISLAVSMIVGGWQIVRYLLEGGRVSVRLRKGWLDESRLIEAPPTTLVADIHPRMWQLPQLHVEVAVVKVTNKGRTAVTISDPTLDVSKESHGWRRFALWQKRWWQRHTVGVRLYDWQNATTDPITRLEPFDSVRFVMDLQPIPAMLLEENRRRATKVRGSMEVAGKRLKRRSPRRHAIRIDAASSAVEPGSDLTPELVAFRRSMATQHGTDSGFPPSLAAHSVKKLLQEQPNPDFSAIAEELKNDSHLERAYQATVLGIDIHRELLRHGLIGDSSEEQATARSAKGPEATDAVEGESS